MFTSVNMKKMKENTKHLRQNEKGKLICGGKTDTIFHFYLKPLGNQVLTETIDFQSKIEQRTNLIEAKFIIFQTNGTFSLRQTHYHLQRLILLHQKVHNQPMTLC